MKKFTTKAELQQYLALLRAGGSIIGFVPTMGALHRGHLSLIQQARLQCDITVCSIFVNPTQFGDPKDLEKYPRPIHEDIEKLEQVNCDVLFNPPVNEMYAGNEKWHLDIGELENILEGKFRPGHYQGVTQVVYKLFDIVKPDVAFFGQKDYQQFMVISRMVSLLNMPVKLVMCPIEREPDGLAMSSRNIHLSADDRKHALVLSRALNWFRENINLTKTTSLVDECKRMINEEPNVQLEYFEVVNSDNLHRIDDNNPNPDHKSRYDVVALVAAKVGNTRLIDNNIFHIQSVKVSIIPPKLPSPTA